MVPQILGSVLHVKIRFILGRKSRDIISFSNELLSEASAHRDIIFVDTPDGDYGSSLSRKTFGLIAWSVLDEARLFKTDDDSYIDISGLLQTLSQFRNDDMHYGGMIFSRSHVRRTGRWSVSYNTFPDEYHPPSATP
jgi:hypothetical protein